MMKSLKITLPLLLLFFLSCEKEPVSSPEDQRADYTGTWTCEESSSLYGNSVYEVDIYEHTSKEEFIVIDNFYNLGFDKNVSVRVSDKMLSIEEQSVGGYLISGFGRLDEGKIQLEWTADDGGGKDKVNATLTEK